MSVETNEGVNLPIDLWGQQKITEGSEKIMYKYESSPRCQLIIQRIPSQAVNCFY